MITNDIKDLAKPEEDDRIAPTEEKVEKEDSLWREGVIHHLSTEGYFWNFSLIYKERSFDVIKWKTAFSWKQKGEDLLMNKGLYIGASGGVFFISVDDKIDENFTKLADMMDVFIEKTKREAPFIVYGILEDKQKIAELKTDKEMLMNLADVKKWVAQHGGEFRIENLKELKMNLTFLVNEYSHFILSKIKGKTKYPNLGVGEVHYLDFEDLASLKEIEEALEEEAKPGVSVDEVLSEMFFDILKRPEFQGEEIIAEAPPEPIPGETVEVEPEIPIEPPPTKIKKIIQEIRLGIRRKCPKCGEIRIINEFVDRKHVIMRNPNIYGKKYVCGMCGTEFKKGGRILKRD